MIESEFEPVLNLCLKCRRRLKTCVCAFLKPFETQSRFIILMHPMEFKKEKVGTGRFSQLILKNSKIIVDVSFEENKEFLQVLKDEEYENFMLYPGDEAHHLNENFSNLFDKKKCQFFIIDGTWPCAKKMVKLTPSLHHMPRVSFSTIHESKFKIKHQPMKGCLSTVESVHLLLSELNQIGMEKTEGAHDNLLEVFEHTVNQQLALAADPQFQGYRRKSFKAPELRKISKKWEKRSLFFKN